MPRSQTNPLFECYFDTVDVAKLCERCRAHAVQGMRGPGRSPLHFEIAVFIHQYRLTHPHGPSLGELSARFERTRPTMHGHLINMTNAGLIEHTRYQHKKTRSAKALEPYIEWAAANLKGG